MKISFGLKAKNKKYTLFFTVPVIVLEGVKSVIWRPSKICIYRHVTMKMVITNTLEW